MTLETHHVDDALRLLSLPRVVGDDPEGGEIVAANGRYGPYLKGATRRAASSNEEQLFTVTLDEALAILAEPKTSAPQGGRRPRRCGSSATTRSSGQPIVV